MNSVHIYQPNAVAVLS